MTPTTPRAAQRTPSTALRIKHALAQLWMGDLTRVVVRLTVMPAGWHLVNPLALYIEFRRFSNSEVLFTIPLCAAVRA
jgi:hypothetical protein